MHKKNTINISVNFHFFYFKISQKINKFSNFKINFQKKMSDRQIKTYMKRLSDSDPLRDIFIKVIIPSLRNKHYLPHTNDIKKRNVCPFCERDINGELLTNCVSFSNYYAYLRHLKEVHRSKLPLNGNIFDSETSSILHKCIPCNKEFGRKDHYVTHLNSHHHKFMTAKENQLPFAIQNETSKKDVEKSENIDGAVNTQQLYSQDNNLVAGCAKSEHISETVSTQILNCDQIDNVSTSDEDDDLLYEWSNRDYTLVDDDKLLVQWANKKSFINSDVTNLIEWVKEQKTCSEEDEDDFILNEWANTHLEVNLVVNLPQNKRKLDESPIQSKKLALLKPILKKRKLNVENEFEDLKQSKKVRFNENRLD